MRSRNSSTGSAHIPGGNYSPSNGLRSRGTARVMLSAVLSPEICSNESRKAGANETQNARGDRAWLPRRSFVRDPFNCSSTTKGRRSPAKLAWPDRAEQQGQGRVSEAVGLPTWPSGIRHRSYPTIIKRWIRHARQHAVADARGRKGEGPHRARRIYQEPVSKASHLSRPRIPPPCPLVASQGNPNPVIQHALIAQLFALVFQQPFSGPAEVAATADRLHWSALTRESA